MYLKKQNQILINDCYEIKIFDTNWQPITKKFEQPKENFDSIGYFCSDKEDRLFIENFSNILIFDANLTFVKNLSVLESYDPSSMQIDHPNILYMSFSSQNKISVYDIETGGCIKVIKIDSPREIAISQESVYVLSSTSYDKKRNTCEFQKFKFGSNCIFVVNKLDYKILSKIEFKDWLSPNGLYLDKYSNIVTTAFQMDNNKFISMNRFLYTIDQDGNLLHKMELHGIQYGNIVFTTDKLINWNSRLVKTIDFI